MEFVTLQAPDSSTSPPTATAETYAGWVEYPTVSQRIEFDAPLILARLQPGEQVLLKTGDRFNGLSCRFHA
ncbi:MAG: hypothetical protein QOJ64_1463 [Acidobacteriota bacterium]|jgi:hypothetical protein|nr:hypothetical protein [Acidobacteriota bacterium]